MFYELSKPVLEKYGAGAGMWYVYTARIPNSSNVYMALFSDGRTGRMLGKIDITLNGDNSMYYFKDEASAHSRACEYYDSHGLAYPYYAAWMALLSPTPDVDVEVESQVMKF